MNQIFSQPSEVLACESREIIGKPVKFWHCPRNGKRWEKTAFDWCVQDRTR